MIDYEQFKKKVYEKVNGEVTSLVEQLREDKQAILNFPLRVMGALNDVNETILHQIYTYILLNKQYFGLEDEQK